MALDQALLSRFIAIVGEKHALTAPSDIAPHLIEPRDRYHGVTPLVLKPGDTAQVSAILALANETGTAIVPQGGNTGHVGGQVPDASGNQIILSLTRLNRIRDLDPSGNTIVAEAGVVLQTLQQAAADADRLFPLTLGSEGSAVVGGLLSTNAGGTAVLHYGNMREQCLGLEVVLPDGRIMSGLSRLRKDNTGYDLKDLFIGAEGTLGIITAASLKLQPKPKGRAVAFIGLASVEDAVALLNVAKSQGMLTGFELIARIAMQFGVKHIEGARDPLSSQHPWYVLAEFVSMAGPDEAGAAMERLLEGALESGLIDDAVIASSEAQANAFWHLRENISWAQKPEGGSIKHDISVPVALVPAFLQQADAEVERRIPGSRLCTFGHLGDGNLHYNVSQPVGMAKDAFLDRWLELNSAIHEIVAAFGGSISAEHGIGQLKKDELARFKDPVALALMRSIKGVIDPKNIMNPGKVL